MAKSLVVWIHVTYYCYLLQPVCTGTTHTSKACYGTDIPCTQHDLRCNSTQKIAIYDAYYTNNTECDQGLSKCDSVNPDNVTDHGYHRFNNAELVSLYQKCSTKRQCMFKGPWQGVARTFSVVKYQYIEGPFLNISGGVAKGLSHVSLIHEIKARHGTATIPFNSYVCNFTSSDNVSNISVYALDSRLIGGAQGELLTHLCVQRGNYITINNCSSVFTPFERLSVTWTTGHIHFEGLSSSIIWLLINASDPFNVSCETLERTTTEYSCTAESTKIASTHTSVSTGTTDNSNNVAGEERNNAGAIAGGVVATVAAVLVVTLASVWILRHRRAKSEVEEKMAPMSKDAKPDMTYTLAGTMPQNNYHEVQDLRKHNSDYDYATATLPPTTNTYLTIEPAGKLTAKDEGEGEYDHIGDKQSPQTGDYDSTASVAQPGHFGEDSYGYNHFQKKFNTQTHQNDYDTAASATKAVAKISTNEKNTDEDDYDHFHRGTNASESVSSPYDTTLGIEANSDYSVAGKMK